MVFTDVPGLKGKLYVPEEERDVPRKHNCPDCAVCQWCSDRRCSACLEECKEKGVGCSRKNPEK